MDLVERLGTYEVTVVPPRHHLRLVWSAPADDGERSVDGDEVGEGDEGGEALPLLASYRITQVPVRVAS